MRSGGVSGHRGHARFVCFSSQRFLAVLYKRLTWLHLSLEEVSQLGAPGDVAGVVVRRVEVLIPARLRQGYFRPEGGVGGQRGGHGGVDVAGQRGRQWRLRKTRCLHFDANRMIE